MSAANIRISFVKDVVYGALTLVVFAAMGWVQKWTTCVHGLSAVCLFVIIATEEAAGVLSWLYLACTAVTVLGDAATILLTTCSLKSCCPPGKVAPVFLWYVDVPNLCIGQSRRVDTQVIALTALVTVAVGILVGLQRIRLCTQKGDQRTGWWTPFLAYACVRIFMLTWVWQYYISAGLSGASLLFHLVAAGGVFVLRRRARSKLNTFKAEIGVMGLVALVLACDITALSLIASGTDGAEEAIAPFSTCQAVAIAIEVWALASVRGAVQSQAPKDDEDKTPDDVTPNQEFVDAGNATGSGLKYKPPRGGPPVAYTARLII